MFKKAVKGLAAGLILATMAVPVFAGNGMAAGAETISLPPLTLPDILRIKNCIISDKKPTAYETAMYDLNNDGVINVMDLSRAVNLIIYDKQVPENTEPVTSEPVTEAPQPVTTSVTVTEPVTQPVTTVTTVVTTVTTVTEQVTTAVTTEAVPVTTVTTSAPPPAVTGPSEPGKWPSYARIEVESVLQTPELPTGCEITALSMLLNHYGFGTDKMSLMKFMPMSGIYTYDGVRYGPDFRKVFPGNPTSTGGYGCYTPCMVTTATDYFRSIGNAEYYLDDLTGADFDILLNYVALGKPVMAWATIGLIDPYKSLTWVTPENMAVTWIANEHVMLITGYDRKNDLVYVNDPSKGQVTYPLEKFRLRYEEIGRYAAVLMKNGEEIDVTDRDQDPDIQGPPLPSVPDDPADPPANGSDDRFRVGDAVYFTGNAYYSSKGGNFVEISGEYTISEIVSDNEIPYRVRLGTVGWVSWDELLLNNTFDYFNM